jgi:hypothetical protein
MHPNHEFSPIIRFSNKNRSLTLLIEVGLNYCQETADRSSNDFEIKPIKNTRPNHNRGLSIHKDKFTSKERGWFYAGSLKPGLI